MIQDKMGMLFRSFPELLERYVSLRALDWEPEGASWDFDARNHRERVSLRVCRDGETWVLQQIFDHQRNTHEELQFVALEPFEKQP
ncbi:hypothetical protein JI721_12380 [Alicyclobacillus cycloheptanicus]|jgi:hypothetical protein|uniref:Uncharacterized protein n=1 Tax=Alicyclobacillus cycloheptanicus TaxID=1457 RepID=A0ABT9XEX8_9BACL|nr:hypothetical protein [Alicyclobacillus cycloheptanicus]MDQ0188847.1 hypothetical protein [Alicyclobacillus cycloheptanicus]WDM00507.1 hypothetical protein JI721_12380 [Alicyclobacillus cycloheptanicus]